MLPDSALTRSARVSRQVYLEVAASDQYEVSGEAAVGLCIPAGRTEVRNFPTNFLALGEVNITVVARAQDGYCDQGNTVAPGRSVRTALLNCGVGVLRQGVITVSV